MAMPIVDPASIHAVDERLVLGYRRGSALVHILRWTLLLFSSLPVVLD